MAKSAAQVGAKWARVTPQRSEDFKSGVQNPTKSWQAETAKAEENYKQGVTKAANAGRFGKGVAAAGDTKWKTNTIAKGVDRWGTGVAVAEGTYTAKIGAVLNTINSVALPPRYPKGDPRNYERSKAIGLALNKAKTGGA